MKYFKNIVLLIALIVPFLLVFNVDKFRDFGEKGWYLLFLIMLIRPLADIFPEFHFLRKLVPLRKELGILCAMLILSHGAGYYLRFKVSFVEKVTDPSFWNYSSHFLWGTLGAIIAFLLLITSNKFAVRILDKWWKRIQRLAYLFFVFGGIHIILTDKDEYLLLVGLEISLFLIVWILSELGVEFRFMKYLKKLKKP